VNQPSRLRTVAQHDVRGGSMRELDGLAWPGTARRGPGRARGDPATGIMARQGGGLAGKQRSERSHWLLV